MCGYVARPLNIVRVWGFFGWFFWKTVASFVPPNYYGIPTFFSLSLDSCKQIALVIKGD